MHIRRLLSCDVNVSVKSEEKERHNPWPFTLPTYVTNSLIETLVQDVVPPLRIALLCCIKSQKNTGQVACSLYSIGLHYSSEVVTFGSIRSGIKTTFTQLCCVFLRGFSGRTCPLKCNVKQGTALPETSSISNIDRNVRRRITLLLVRDRTDALEYVNWRGGGVGIDV
jgi:hypothetical protein